MQRACFLDRDGVVNEEVEYLSDPDKAIIIPGTTHALKTIRAHGYMAIVVSNQAGVARGFYSSEDVDKVNARIQQLLEKDGAGIDEFLYCPHHPEFTGECNCRKPEPGMFLRAAEKYDIDLSQSLMVGDRMSDLEAAKRAGCHNCYLVRTGYGDEVIAQSNPVDVKIADNLDAAVSDFFKGKCDYGSETGHANTFEQ